MKGLDEKFTALLYELEEAYQRLPTQQRIFTEQWVIKLSEPIKLQSWKKNRNMYAKLLVNFVKEGALREPFNKRPPDGPIQTLPSYMMMHLRPRSASRRRGGSQAPGTPQRRRIAPATRSLEMTEFRGLGDTEQPCEPAPPEAAAAAASRAAEPSRPVPPALMRVPSYDAQEVAELRAEVQRLNGRVLALEGERQGLRATVEEQRRTIGVLQELVERLSGSVRAAPEERAAAVPEPAQRPFGQLMAESAGPAPQRLSARFPFSAGDAAAFPAGEHGVAETDAFAGGTRVAAPHYAP